jgi:hypothetical protein
MIRVLIVGATFFLTASFLTASSEAAPLVANPPILEFGSCQGAITGGQFGCRASGTPLWSSTDTSCAIDETPPIVVRCDLIDAYDGGKTALPSIPSVRPIVRPIVRPSVRAIVRPIKPRRFRHHVYVTRS